MLAFPPGPPSLPVSYDRTLPGDARSLPILCFRGSLLLSLLHFVSWAERIDTRTHRGWRSRRTILQARNPCTRSAASNANQHGSRREKNVLGLTPMVSRRPVSTLPSWNLSPAETLLPPLRPTVLSPRESFSERFPVIRRPARTRQRSVLRSHSVGASKKAYLWMVEKSNRIANAILTRKVRHRRLASFATRPSPVPPSKSGPGCVRSPGTEGQGSSLICGSRRDDVDRSHEVGTSNGRWCFVIHSSTFGWTGRVHLEYPRSKSRAREEHNRSLSRERDRNEPPHQILS